jgi:LysM repeat protein
MRLAPFATGLAVAAAIAVVGTPAAHAQITNNQNSKNDQKNTVVVNEGDTLDGIATSHQTTYVRLFDANNNIQDPDVIYPGQNVRIPSADEQLPDRPLPADAAPVAQTAPAASQPQAQQTSYSAPAAAVSAPVVQSGPVSGCGDNAYANYIYMHESGCRTTAMNASGCYGIGQACPGSKIAYCGADYACQNAWFTAYAGKYGGWEGAYNHWITTGWW